MKKDLADSEIRKLLNIKKPCMPYKFLVYTTEKKWKDDPMVKVEDILKIRPGNIRKMLNEYTSHHEWERNIRKSLKKIVLKLTELGFSEKDGPFMSGIYFVTMHSNKEEWVRYFISEFGVKKQEAEEAYQVGVKFKLI